MLGSEACTGMKGRGGGSRGWGWGEGIAPPCFQHRIYVQECKVNCTGMGHGFINPA